jgi:hypothetical protein
MPLYFFLKNYHTSYKLQIFLFIHWFNIFGFSNINSNQLLVSKELSKYVYRLMNWLFNFLASLHNFGYFFFFSFIVLTLSYMFAFLQNCPNTFPNFSIHLCFLLFKFYTKILDSPIKVSYLFFWILKIILAFAQMINFSNFLFNSFYFPLFLKFLYRFFRLKNFTPKESNLIGG